MLTPYICRQMQRASMTTPVNAPKYEEETITEQSNKQEGKQFNGLFSSNFLVEQSTNAEEDDDLVEPTKLPVQYRNDIVLKLLNSNTEDPYLIWNNATRAELLDFVERHRNSNENLVCQ